MRRTALQSWNLDCLGMPLTTVSNPWPNDGREAWLPSQRKPYRGRPALGQWSASRNKARTRAPKATRAFGWRGRKATCGRRQRRPSSKPFAASAIAPGPFRGWGRKPLACIHTQREPDVSPAGTGTEHPWPEGPPHGSRGGEASGRPSGPRRGTPIKGMATSTIRGAMTFSPRRPVLGRRGAHTVAEGDARWRVPPCAGRLPRRQESGRRGRGTCMGQDALGTVRGLRGASRLRAKDSTGTVPLQSG